MCLNHRVCSQAAALFSDMLANLVFVETNSTAYLFQSEDVIVEVILQLLICIVDAELLKAVSLKILKAKNVQNANGQTLKNKSYKC